MSWLGVRAWWYLRISPKRPIPKDVRMYIMRHSLEPAIQRASSKEAKDKIIGEAMYTALHDDEIDAATTDYIIKICFAHTDPAPPLAVPTGPYPEWAAKQYGAKAPPDDASPQG